MEEIDNGDLSVEERAARIVAQDLIREGKRFHEVKGQPYGIPTLSPERELWGWMHEDETIDVEGLRAQGLTDVDIAAQRYPLRPKLINQASMDRDEQRAYSDRMAARAEKALASGKLPRPPDRKILER